MDHVAVDVGGRESQICIRSSSNEIKLEKRVPTSKLKEFFGGIEPSRIILETCAEAFAIAGQAKDVGHEVRIVPATLVRSLGVGQRGIKTDQRDARCLSEASARVELVSVHIPSGPSRELKASCGMREATVAARTKLINNVRGWMRGQLVRIRGGGTKTFPARLRAHYFTQNLELPSYVLRQLNAIESLTKEIDEADRELLALAKGNSACQRLMTVPGVGPITSIRFLSAVDHPGRFVDAHRLESYFGLTPGEHSSSDSKYRTSLTKAGSTKVRWVLVQAAWSALRCRPYDPMVLWAQQVAKRRGRKVAAAALSRKIAGIMFAILRDGSSYNATRASTVRLKDMDVPSTIASGAQVVLTARSRPGSSEGLALPPAESLTTRASQTPAVARAKRSSASASKKSQRSERVAKTRSSTAKTLKSKRPVDQEDGPKRRETRSKETRRRKKATRKKTF